MNVAKGVRVNLSVPERIDQVLTDLAELTGRSKASWVMEAIEFQLPSWYDRRTVLQQDGAYLSVNQCLPKNKGRVVREIGKREGRRIDQLLKVMDARVPPDDDLPDAQDAEDEYRTMFPHETRQQRRLREREEKKELNRQAKKTPVSAT